MKELSRDKSIFDSGAHLRPLEKKKVLDLENSTGSRWSAPYKVPGVDSLPVGVSYNDSKKVVTVTSTFSGYLEGWDFTGKQVAWQSGQVKLRDCILGERDGATEILTYLDIYSTATVYEISYNDIIGPNSYGGASPAILYRVSSGKGPGIAGDNGNSDGWVHHNSFTNLTEDAIKPTGGLIEYNAIIYDKNLDFAGQNVDPHSDAINPHTITHPLTIRRNFIKMSQRTDGLYKGANNAFRVVPNGSTAVPYRQAQIYENVVIGSAREASFLFSAETKGMPAYVGPAFVNNWVRPKAQKVFYPTYGADTIWHNNIDLDTGAVLDSGKGNPLRNPIPETDRADVPLSGTSSAGAVIQARAVSVDDKGATTTLWTDIATADGSGNWSGTLSAPRNTSWLRPEVRLKAHPETTVQATNRFAAGHVWARWSQSDEYHIYGHNGTVKPDAVQDDDALQIVFMTRDTKPRPAGSAFLQKITNAAPGKPGFVAMSNALAKELPGQKIMIGLHAHSGMGVDDRVNEQDDKRWKSDEQQIQDILTADGSKVGFVHEFFSSGTPTGLLYPEALGPIQFGINPDGSTFVSPGTVPSGYQTQRVDWTLTDFYDWSHTRMGFIVGYDDAGRDRLKKMIQHPVYKKFFVADPVGPKGFGGWLKGELSADGSRYTDPGHPGIEDPRGTVQMAAVITYAALAQIGLTSGGMPVIDTIELYPNGNKKAVALGWTGGNMTTTRRSYGRPRLDGSKYTDVKNIGWNGQNIRAEIRDDSGNLADRGRIWIYKPDQSDWVASDLAGISLASPWASVTVPEEITNGWQFDDMPCGVIGTQGVVPVITEYSPSDLFSNYTAYAPGRKTSSAATTTDTDGIPTTTGGTSTTTTATGGTSTTTTATGGTSTTTTATSGTSAGTTTATAGTAGGGLEDGNSNPNVAAAQVVAFDPAYWEDVSGFVPNKNGTLSVDLSTFNTLSNKTAGAGQPRININASATHYEIRAVVTSPNPGSLGQVKVLATTDNGYGAVEILLNDYKSFPGGNVPTELIWTTTSFAPADRKQMKLYFKTGKGGSGIATISDLTVKTK